MTQRGFTLVELLVAAMVMAVLGSALVRMLVSDSEFASQQDAMVGARRTARGALNVVAPELRMVGRDGLLAATRDSIRLRVPYAFGIICTGGKGDNNIALLPPDSLQFASAQPAGLAWHDWKDTTGTYNFVSNISVSSVSNSRCPADSIPIQPGAPLLKVGPKISAAPVGSVFYLYQEVTYRFGTSTTLPGRVALWRQVGTATAQELLSPFDSSAKFRCLVGASLRSVDCPPAGGLGTVRGVELRLVGASERAPEGRTAPEQFDLTAKIPFVNWQQP